MSFIRVLLRDESDLETLCELAIESGYRVSRKAGNLLGWLIDVDNKNVVELNSGGCTPHGVTGSNRPVATYSPAELLAFFGKEAKALKPRLVPMTPRQMIELMIKNPKIQSRVKGLRLANIPTVGYEHIVAMALADKLPEPFVENWEYSIDGCETWLPFMVEEV